MKKFKEFWMKKAPKIKKKSTKFASQAFRAFVEFEIAEESVENLDTSLARFSTRVSFLNFA